MEDPQFILKYITEYSNDESKRSGMKTEDHVADPNKLGLKVSLWYQYGIIMNCVTQFRVL